MKSGELDGEWRVKSGEWREVWGNICGCRGTERTGNVLRAGWPARVPCNPAPTVEFVSIAIRKVPGSKDVPAGGACPAPTNGGIFAAVAGQGQPRNVPAGRIARKGALQSGPYRWGNICGCRGTERPRNVPAGRIAREGALQSGPYRWGNICGCRGTERPRNAPAGRMAREGALQSGPYE